jgi:predicted choloylglycine hydrolase
MRFCTVFATLVAFALLVTGCTRTSTERAAQTPNQATDAAAVKTIPGRLQVLVLEGTPYNRGLVHGKTLRDKIHEGIRLWKTDLHKTYKMDPDAFIKRFVQQTNYLPAIKKWTPELLEEIRGIAEGSGIDFDTMLVFQLIDEYWVNGGDVAVEHCSSLGFRKSGEYPSYIAQNVDYECFRDGFQVVLHIKHKDSDLESLVLSQAGLIGSNGMNNKAVGICVNTLSQLSYCRDGLPVNCIVRGVLQRRTVEDAVVFLRRIKHASGQNYIVGGRTAVYDFECSANRVAAYQPRVREGVVWHTNHPFVNKDYNARYRALLKKKEDLAKNEENSRTRLQSLETRLTKDSGVQRLDRIKTALASQDSVEHPVCRPVTRKDWFTFGSTLMVLSENPEFHVSSGPPDVAPYETLSFTSRAK